MRLNLRLMSAIGLAALLGIGAVIAVATGDGAPPGDPKDQARDFDGITGVIATDTLFSARPLLSGDGDTYVGMLAISVPAKDRGDLVSAESATSVTLVPLSFSVQRPRYGLFGVGTATFTVCEPFEFSRENTGFLRFPSADRPIAYATYPGKHPIAIPPRSTFYLIFRHHQHLDSWRMLRLPQQWFPVRQPADHPIHIDLRDAEPISSTTAASLVRALAESCGH